MSQRGSIKKNIDWITLILYFSLVIIGWFSIYAAGYEFNLENNFFDFSQRYGKQLIWIGLASIIGLSFLFIDSKVYSVLAYLIYAIGISLLIVTLFLATEIKGSKSWLVFGPVSIQPAEFAKFTTALALAKYMSSFNFKINNLKNILIALCIIFIPFVIILLQNETGTALVYIAFMFVLYREGMSGFVLFLGFWAVLLVILIIRYADISIMNEKGEMGLFLSYISIIISLIIFLLKEKKYKKTAFKFILINFTLFFLAYFLNKLNWANFNLEKTALFSLILFVIFFIWRAIKDRSKKFLLLLLFCSLSVAYCYSVDYIFDNFMQTHQQVRIKETLGVEHDPSGAGYNVNQSKIAIGSGGIKGKGFLNGTQTKLKYVPEQDTDFIFCTIGEEHGFIGSIVVLTLFLILLLRLIFLAERQRSSFSRIYGYSLVSILFFHLLINIGMVIGITPVIGIPLPFISYGGSSLWGFTILLFVFIKLDIERMERF